MDTAQFTIDDLAMAMFGTQKASTDKAFSMPTNLDVSIDAARPPHPAQSCPPPMLVRQHHPCYLNLGASHALVCGTETISGPQSLVTPFNASFVPTPVYTYSPNRVTSASMSPTTSTSSMASCIDPYFLTASSLPPSPIRDPRSPIKTEHGDRLMLLQAERVPSSSSSVLPRLPEGKYWSAPPKRDMDREQGSLTTDDDADGIKPSSLANPFGTPQITPPLTPPLVKDSSPYTDAPLTPPTAQVVTPTKKRAATSLSKSANNKRNTTTTAPPTKSTSSSTSPNMAHYSAGVYYESEDDELQDERVSDYTPPPKPTKATPTKRVRKAPTPSPPAPARSSKPKSSAHTKASSTVSAAATRPKPKSASWIARAGERRMAQNRSAQFKYRNKNKRLEELRFEFSADVGSAVTQLNRGEITPSKAMQAISSACSRYEQDTAMTCRTAGDKLQQAIAERL